MKRRAVTGLLGAGVGLLLLSPAAAAGAPVRQSFDIAAGSPADTYFPLSELIARAVSHPPGLARCEQPGVCGPAGLVVSTRSSDGALANVLAVEKGEATSALAPGDVVADAAKGRGAFRLPLRHVRIMAAVLPETMQIVVAARSKLRRLADLSGKCVSPGSEGSGGEIMARKILASAGVSWRGLKLARGSLEDAALRLSGGTCDAIFALGAAPSPVIAGLIGHGSARLLAIDGPARRRLLAHYSGLTAATLPPGTYGNAAPVGTAGTAVLWIVRDSAAPSTVYELVRALFHPANRPALAALSLSAAVEIYGAPLHAGAERYFRETGRWR